jgi:hypothetical protein
VRIRAPAPAADRPGVQSAAGAADFLEHEAEGHRMGMALTWWGWSGLMASVGVILALWARHAWRAAVRDELVAYLAHAAPEIAVTDVLAGAIVYRTGDSDMSRTFLLGEFYRRLGTHPGGSAEAEAARLEVFAGAALAMRINGSPAPMAETYRRAS